jgi:hypothetical protein
MDSITCRGMSVMCQRTICHVLGCSYRLVIAVQRNVEKVSPPNFLHSAILMYCFIKTCWVCYRTSLQDLDSKRRLFRSLITSSCCRHVTGRSKKKTTALLCPPGAYVLTTLCENLPTGTGIKIWRVGGGAKKACLNFLWYTDNLKYIICACVCNNKLMPIALIYVQLQWLTLRVQMSYIYIYIYIYIWSAYSWCF